MISIENNILLLQNNWRVLKNFYKKIFDSDHPINSTIQTFVENKTFLSSQYVDAHGINLIRHFFITRENALDFQGHFVSTIPISAETFFQPAYFQSQALYDDYSAFQRTCLRQLVAGKDGQEFDCASTDRHILQENIYIMKHKFLDVEGHLLIINVVGLIEIFCERGFLLFKNTGFVVISISFDCKVNFNANLLIKNTRSTFGLKPTVLYQLKQGFVQHHIHEIWMYKIVLIIVLCVCICLLSTGLLVVWLTFKWVQTTSQPPKAHLHEMQRLNIPKRERKVVYYC